MSDRPSRDDLIEQALAMPPTLRAEFLRLACGADLPLRRELERLLEVDRHARGDVADGGMADQPVWEPGSTVDEFVVRELIGMGRMGAVYRAHHPQSGSDVALKLFSRFGASLLRRPQQQELRTAQLMRRVNHEGVVRIFFISQHQGRPFLVMELVEGQDLATFLSKRRSIDVAQCADWLTQLAAAVQAAHVRGVLHLDLRPSNIFLTTDGRIKLLEFEITRHGGPAGGFARAVVGTPAYMAPEQLSGELQWPGTDVYAFGMVLLDLFARPLSRGTESVNGDATRQRPAIEDLARVAPSAIVDLFKRATALRPSDRIQTFDEIIRILRNVHPPWTSRFHWIIP